MNLLPNHSKSFSLSQKETKIQSKEDAKNRSIRLPLRFLRTKTRTMRNNNHRFLLTPKEVLPLLNKGLRIYFPIATLTQKFLVICKPKAQNSNRFPGPLGLVSAA
jgi:hypothetical protein